MRKKQTGIAVDLILYAVFAAGLLIVVGTAWHNFKEGIRDETRAEVELKYKPFSDECTRMKATVAACVQNWKDTLAANVSIKADADKCIASAGIQSKAVKEAEAAAAAAKANSARILAELAKRQREGAAYVAGLNSKAATPSANRAGECDDADSISRDIANQRMRFYGGTSPSGDVGANNGNPGSGPGALRIGK
jgi:hypothetical protein